jgi:hypothetical protein
MRDRETLILGLQSGAQTSVTKKNLQSQRRATEASQLSEAAALCQMDQKRGLRYQLAEDGFAFSNTESRPSSDAATA